MLYLVSGNQILGTTNDREANGGFQVIEGPDAAIADLCVVGDRIERKPLRPPKPSPDAIWDGQAWVIPPPLPAPPDWGKLLNSLRGTPVMGKLIAASSSTLKANTAYTILSSVLTHTGNAQDFEWALSLIRTEMATLPDGDFTADEVSWINEQLAAANIQINLS